MNEFDILCKCGHSKDDHEPDEDNYVVCQGCWDSDLDSEKLCELYVPDNLMHIEVLAKQRGLV